MDLLLLHPPSVYDFREKSILYGPVSDMVPSSVMFELYPIGFLTMAGYLQERGMEVRIANVALRMLTDKRFDVRRFLARQKPRLIGIDLHWMPHCHGAIEIARIAKEVHPDVPVIFGGLSSTYFHEELLAYPEIDYVLRGDSTEPPLHQLLLALQGGARRGPLAAIPNLTWRDADGKVRVNPLSFVPQTLDYVDVKPELLIEMAIRYRDLVERAALQRLAAQPDDDGAAAQGLRLRVHHLRQLGHHLQPPDDAQEARLPQPRQPGRQPRRHQPPVARHDRHPRRPAAGRPALRAPRSSTRSPPGA
jgi:hypothetical protein